MNLGLFQACSNGTDCVSDIRDIFIQIIHIKLHFTKQRVMTGVVFESGSDVI